jgi:acetyl esterase/lipase
MRYLARTLPALLLALSAVAFATPAGAAPAAGTAYYGPQPLQSVTIYASSTADAPVVVLIHGGGFSSSAEDAASLADDAKRLRSAGASAFIVNYRDDSAAPAFPDEVDDVVAGTQWVVAHAADFDGNPGNLDIVGGSAGALLVGDAVEQLDADAPGTVNTVLTLSATGDLAMMLSYWSAKGGKSATKHIGNILPALGCATAASCPVALEQQWSPDLQLTPAECPSHWLIYETHKDYLPAAGTEAMHAALVAAGCAVTNTLLGGSSHGYSLFPTAEPAFLASIGL